MPSKRILILGGTGSARQAATELVLLGHEVTYSLAGVTHSPQLPKGQLRMGGFGGVEGLNDYLEVQHIEVVVDGTHAFAAQMSAQAEAACTAKNVRLLRLEAPAWKAQVNDHWIEVADTIGALKALPLGAKCIVTVGRKDISAFFARADLSGVARMIKQPNETPSPRWQILLEKPPFNLDTEIDLLRSPQAEFLVSKNAGGIRPAKLDAAAALGLSVIMIARPFKPAVFTVDNMRDLVAAI